MRVALISRWILSRWGREPWVWAVWVALLVLWPAQQILTPFSSGVSAPGTGPELYELAFVGAGLGSACAVHALSNLQVCAHELGLRRPWLAEWVAMWLCGVPFLFAALGVPLVLVGLTRASLCVELALPALLLHLQFAALGLLLLRLPLGQVLRPVMLFLLAGFLPALSSASSPLSLFGALSYPMLESSLRWTLLASQLASIMALLACVHMLERHRPSLS